MTPDQDKAVDDLIAAVNDYLTQLHQQVMAAIMAGNEPASNYLQSCYDRNLDLLHDAVDAKAAADLPGLTAATSALNDQAQQLTAEKTAIEATVKLIGDAASVISALTKVVTTIASLAALV